jgi:hypothetical protein
LDDQLERVIEVLQALAVLRAWEETEARGDRYSDLTGALVGRFRPLVETEFNSVRPRLNANKAVELQFIHLPLTNRDSLVPILHVRLIPHHETVRLGFCVGLYGAKAATPKRHPNFDALGFRFEEPEGTDEEQSEHNYYHAQPSASYGRHGLAIGGANPLSIRLPAFPLDATTRVELLLATLMSIYGRRQTEELVAAIGVRPLGRWPGSARGGG